MVAVNARALIREYERR